MMETGKLIIEGQEAETQEILLSVCDALMERDTAHTRWHFYPWLLCLLMLAQSPRLNLIAIGRTSSGAGSLKDSA